MIAHDNSGPAFPTVKQVDRDGYVQVDANNGISARDYFAAKVASGDAATDDGWGERATDEQGGAVRGRRPAIDLKLLPALSVIRNARRSKAASSHVQTQVARARSMCTPVTTPTLEPETQAIRQARLQVRLLALLEPSLHEFALDRIDKAKSSRAEPDSYLIPAECMPMTALLRRSSRGASV